jgi:hypothetical protein
MPRYFIGIDNAYRDAFDEELAMNPETAHHSKQFVDDPMDLTALTEQLMAIMNNNKSSSSTQYSNNRKNIICHWCNKPGHVKANCRTRKYEMIRFEKQHMNQNRQRTNTGYHNNNNSNKYGNNDRYKKYSSNHNDNRNLLNLLMDKLDNLSANNSHPSNNNEHQAQNSNASFNSKINKDLIDLSAFSDEDSYSSYFPSDLYINVVLDTTFVNSMQKNLSTTLPLYNAMIGGSDFSVLIDSGASANYVHPKFLNYSKSVVFGHISYI